MWVETRIVLIPGFGQNDFNRELVCHQNGRVIFFTAKRSKDLQRERKFFILPTKPEL
jgi:hypothetical protein